MAKGYSRFYLFFNCRIRDFPKSQPMLGQGMEERLIELETKISFQDQVIEDLNIVVIELRRELEKQALLLKKMIEANEDSNLKDASLEVPPPHY